MAIVGTAYVEVRAVTDKVRSEVRDGFQKGMSGVGTEAGQAIEQEMLPGMEKTGDKAGAAIERKMKESGGRSGFSFAERFRMKVWNASENLSSKMLGLFGRSGDDSGNAFGQKFWGGAQKHFSKVPIGKLGMAGLVSFIPSLIGLIGQLGGGLVALGSSISQAAGVAPVLYSTLVPLVSILGSVKLAFHGVGAAMQVLNNPDATAKAKQDALSKLAPAARDLAKYLSSLQPKLQALRNTAAKNLLPGLEEGLKGAMTLFGPFRHMIGSITSDVGNMARQVGGFFKSSEGQLLVHGIFRGNERSVHNLTGAFTPLLASLLRVYHAMQPVQIEFTKMIQHGAQMANQWTGSHGNTMADYFQRAWQKALQLGRIIGNLVATVLNVGKAASSAGNTMLDSIERVTQGWQDLTGKTKTQNSMEQYFKSTIPVMREVTGMIGDMIKFVVKLGGSNKDLLPLLQQIRDQLGPAIGNLLQASTGPLASEMVNLFTDLVKVLTDLTGSGGVGFLTSFAKALDDVFKALDAILGIPVIGKLAGYLLGIAGAVAAYGKVISMVKGFTLVKMITGLGAASAKSAVEVDALGASLTAEAAAAERAALATAGASKGGFLGGFKGKLGRAGGIWAAGSIAQSVIGGSPTSGRGQFGNVLGTAATGAAIGSIVPGVGTAVGAGVGAAAGAVMGMWQNHKANEQSKADQLAQYKALAHTKEGYAQLQAEMNKFNGMGAKTGGMVKSLTSGAADQIKTILDDVDAEHLHAIATADYSKSAFNAKRATDQYTNSLSTHTSKMFAASSSYDSFRSQLNSLKAQVDQNGRSLKGYSDGAIANRAALQSASQAIFDHMSAMKANGATAKQMQRSLADMSTRLRDQATAAFGSKDAVDAFLGEVGLMPGKIKRALAGLKAMGLAAGGDLGHGFVIGIQQSQGAATTAAKILADQTVKHMREDALLEHSPSKHGIDMGYFLGLGFAHGITKSKRHAMIAAEDLARSTLSTLFKQVDHIVSGLRSRRQSMRDLITQIGTDVRDAIRTSVKATNKEERNMRNELSKSFRSMQNTLRSAAQSLHNREETLRGEIADAKSNKTRAKYVAELNKIERQRRKVLDIRAALDNRETRMLRFMRNQNEKMDEIAARRMKVTEHLQRVQDRLASLRSRKADIEGAVLQGISAFTNITATVPQGMPITTSRIIAGMQGRLATVKQFAKDIRTLIKRGLNRTMITELINEGPDVGGQYARVLAEATDVDLKTLNQTQKSINNISTGLADYVGNEFFQSGIKAAKGIIKGLKDRQNELDKAAAEMGRRMAKALKDALGIKSPSRVMRDQIGQYVPMGIAEGIDKGAPHAVRAIHRLNHKLLAASAVAISPSLAAQQAGATGPLSIQSPLLAIEHLHVRSDEDITKIEQMLYKAANNVARASGKRQVVPTT